MPQRIAISSMIVQSEIRRRNLSGENESSADSGNGWRYHIARRANARGRKHGGSWRIGDGVPPSALAEKHRLSAAAKPNGIARSISAHYGNGNESVKIMRRRNINIERKCRREIISKWQKYGSEISPCMKRRAERK